MPEPPLLEMMQITKAFDGVTVLRNVHFSCMPREIIALVGENGAGKSTLIKILAGAFPDGTFEGEIRLAGEMVRFRTIEDAAAAGIVMIPQEPQAVPELSVAENIFLNREPTRMGLIDLEVMLERASALLSEFDIDLDPQRPMGQLGMPMRQVVEIAKALAKRARILILDEPTSALTPHEARVLFGHMRRLRKNGVTCIFISHRIGEVLEVADRATVLRDGQVIDTVETASTTPSQLIAKMIGRDLRDLFPARSHEIGPPILEVGKLTIAHPDQPHRPLVDGVTFELRRGEILGLFGLIGAGRTELVTALFGAWRGGYTGEIHVRGQPASITTPTDAIRYGLGLLTEDRQLSVIFSMGIAPNISLASLDRLCRWSLIDEAGERGLAETFIEALSIRAPSLATPVRHLSGGNQQKVVLSRWLAIDPQVLIMDEPTKGVDIGAKAEIFGIMRRLTERGIGIILISSELPEILGMSDRVLVMFEGKAVAEFVTATASEDQIMTYATGGTPGASI